MIIDNSKALAYFDAVDKVKYYQKCRDISLAGNDYFVMGNVFFVKCVDDPFSDYIQVKKYDDRTMIFWVYTEDTALISECLEYIKGIKNEFDEIDVRTPFLSVLDHEDLNQQFSMDVPTFPDNPVYYIHTLSELNEIRHNPGVSVSRMSEADKIEIADNVKAGKLDEESMGEDAFRQIINYKDVIWYILRVDGDIAGYLRAECGYADIYDIGWIYVEERYRGNGYATELASWFSRDIFDNGAIPHYGCAITEASARVAEKCGYQCDHTDIICRSLKPKFGA